MKEKCKKLFKLFRILSVAGIVAVSGFTIFGCDGSSNDSTPDAPLVPQNIVSFTIEKDSVVKEISLTKGYSDSYFNNGLPACGQEEKGDSIFISAMSQALNSGQDPDGDFQAAYIYLPNENFNKTGKITGQEIEFIDIVGGTEEYSYGTIEIDIIVVKDNVIGGTFSGTLEDGSVITNGFFDVLNVVKPEASFPEGLSVYSRQAETADIAGLYVVDGTENGYTRYVSMNDPGTYRVASSTAGVWAIYDGETSMVYKNNLKNQSSPWSANNSWFLGDGSSLTNDQMPIISSTTIGVIGNTVVGETLTGNYIFKDKNGGTDSSTYQWYRVNDDKPAAEDYILITGATGKTYTLTADDIGKYICFEVTPVSSLGNKGEAARSEVYGTSAVE